MSSTDELRTDKGGVRNDARGQEAKYNGTGLSILERSVGIEDMRGFGCGGL